MTRLLTRAAPATLLALGTVAGAQQVPNARPLGATIATVAEPFGGVQSLRQLPDGRLLVNDPSKRRVILFDADLSKYTVVADSTSATANAYSGRIAGLIPYRADSTLFVDPTSMSMLVIDPKGNIGTRVMSVPRPDDAFALTGLAFGLPGFDKQGRLVYRAQPSFAFMRGGPGPGSPGFKPPQMPDSAPIVRVELATRKVDTVTFVKTYAPKMTMTQGENGRISMSSVLNPLPTVDDWAITPDGTIVVLRGREFRVDYTDASGTLVQGPKVAHDWQRMSDEEKVAFLDSTKTAMEKARADMQARIQQNGGNVERAMAAGAAAAGAGGPPMPMIRIEMAGGGGGEPPRRGEQRGPNGAAPNANITMPPLNFVEPSELPDYKPAFAAGATRADADGNVWVRLIATKPMPGPVYDIIDKDGKLLDRVVLPPNSAIAGFGPGVVYLATRDADGTHLKKVAVK